MTKPVSMTKSYAVAVFRDIVGTSLDKDKVAKRCAWNDFTDMLHKCGDITDRQVNTWVSPFDN